MLNFKSFWLNTATFDQQKETISALIKKTQSALRHCDPLPRLAGFGFPLQDYASKQGKTWLPRLMLPWKFLNLPSRSAFWSGR
jgi:hypothetical protein